jgi:TonB family protein
MRSALASLAVHGALVGGMAWFLAHDGGHVAGSAGLTGPTSTRFDVTMDAVKEPVAVKPPAPPDRPLPHEVSPLVREGLPVEAKVEKPREIETPPEPERREHSDGNSDSAFPGRAGQGGAGDAVAANLGDSDRTNRLGLYLQKMTRKIQSNLGSAGMLRFPTKAMLLLELKRDGNVAKITVVRTSGDPTLDRLAIRAVQKSIPFDPWDQDQSIQVPVIFRGVE